MTIDLGLPHLAEAVFVRFLQREVTFFPPFSIMFYLEGSHYSQPTLKGWVITSSSFRWSVYTNYLEFFMGDLSSLLICSIIYLYQYRLMDGDCILWVIIKYYLLILFNFPSSGHWEHSQLASLPLWNTPINVLLLSFEKSLEGLYISYPSSRSSHWSKEPQLLLLDHGLRNQSLRNGPTCCQQVVFA